MKTTHFSRCMYVLCMSATTYYMASIELKCTDSKCLPARAMPSVSIGANSAFFVFFPFCHPLHKMEKWEMIEVCPSSEGTMIVSVSLR